MSRMQPVLNICLNFTLCLYTQYVKGEQGEMPFIILFNSFLRLKRFMSLLLGV